MFSRREKIRPRLFFLKFLVSAIGNRGTWVFLHIPPKRFKSVRLPEVQLEVEPALFLAFRGTSKNLDIQIYTRSLNRWDYDLCAKANCLRDGFRPFSNNRPSRLCKKPRLSISLKSLLGAYPHAELWSCFSSRC